MIASTLTSNLIDDWSVQNSQTNWSETGSKYVILTPEMDIARWKNYLQQVYIKRQQQTKTMMTDEDLGGKGNKEIYKKYF